MPNRVKQGEGINKNLKMCLRNIWMAPLVEPEREEEEEGAPGILVTDKSTAPKSVTLKTDAIAELQVSIFV